ncbi:alkaline phosphatase family protein [Caldicellulosiruptor naganoensis]|uniref:Alkaline phosphatase family protein n=1 Tax=Caldicellulosiruptor naganoensis TaxID=29324 RepID=A0ABY7BHZ3_9FIRM|nr:alkaline phosphatase family protein [Caldicellulosiruptor naganoensis]WAM32453.1 alkaline phosphatase family protein [Caldicellulosiruptor naganoensis]
MLYFFFSYHPNFIIEPKKSLIAEFWKQLEKKSVSRNQVLEKLKKVFGDDKVGRAIVSAITKPSSQPRKGEPFYNAKSSIDVFYGDKARPASEVGKLALDSIDKYGKGRFFAFFHFGDPDTAGHKYGENSQEYSNAIIEVDKWLGRIVEKLKALGIYNETRIYVTSDHGFDEGKTTHSMASDVFFATNDAEIKRRGDQRDIVPTILVRMEVDVSRFNPPLPGRLLTEPERSW